MSQVTMLASFNFYQDPPIGALVIGSGLAIAVLVALAFSRSALAGFFGGAISLGVIAFFVFATGGGDLAGVFAMFLGIVGAVAGLVAGLLGKATKSESLITKSGLRQMQSKDSEPKENSNSTLRSYFDTSEIEAIRLGFRCIPQLTFHRLLHALRAGPENLKTTSR